MLAYIFAYEVKENESNVHQKSKQAFKKYFQQHFNSGR